VFREKPTILKELKSQEVEALKRLNALLMIPLLLFALGFVGGLVAPVLVAASPQATGMLASTTAVNDTAPAVADINTGLTSLGAGIGAGVAIGFAGLGAGIGLGAAGSAAIGAITERPEVFGRTIIFAALIEGIAIFGFVVGLLLWLKVT